ncbi:hypothetical protein OS121_29440 [Mycolicibacterium mucogenicum]|jgi:hypothetical protein|uniref:hypothetical protein n=1 Tax=Mycolicibacterium mucogenicum TaxID=56689 RepID=UPI000A58C608|nr:hypothetical protein [Mycolicibacterium mucogenicum]MCX8559172.1 hypothetical protein [Mycolicibacterium mucogenicum]
MSADRTPPIVGIDRGTTMTAVFIEPHPTPPRPGSIAISGQPGFGKSGGARGIVS